MKKHFDFWSMIVVALTLVLFVVALFVKGLTHDILLETGIFLVSVKLILLSYQNNMHINDLKERLNELKSLIKNRNEKG